MYIVGIDIAKRTHEAIVIDREGAIILKPFNFKNSKDGFQYFMQKLNSISTSTSDFTFAMESTSHYWIALYSALMKTSSSIHVINPLQSSALRNLYIRKVKSDSHDCFVIAEVIRFGRFTRNTLPSPQLYELRELCRGRTFIVDMCSDLKKKTIALLDQVFPEYESFLISLDKHLLHSYFNIQHPKKYFLLLLKNLPNLFLYLAKIVLVLKRQMRFILLHKIHLASF